MNDATTKRHATTKSYATTKIVTRHHEELRHQEKTRHHEVTRHDMIKYCHHKGGVTQPRETYHATTRVFKRDDNKVRRCVSKLCDRHHQL